MGTTRPIALALRMCVTTALRTLESSFPVGPATASCKASMTRALLNERGIAS